MKAEYISHYLTDSDVANFARQSFGKLAENFSKDANDSLVKFLARGMASGDWGNLINEMLNLNKANASDVYNEHSIERAKELAVYLRSIPEHWVPFGHPHITLRMQAPMPIRTQCYKHKIGFVESEESRRYVKTTPEIYIPPAFRAVAENVKQGSGGKHERSDYYLERYDNVTSIGVSLFEEMVADGICPEQARFVLPQGAQVNWVWTGSLYAFSQAYNARSDSHAQKEVQWLFEDINKIIEPLFPVSWAALTRGSY